MAQCITPYSVRDKKTGQTIPVPCGKCPQCITRRVSGWSFRLMQEDKISLQSWFVTLTYAPEHVPMTSNKFMTLNKKHCQDFMKLLRYYQNEFYKQRKIPKKEWRKIRYYTAGEYGSEGARPHYHIILFDAYPECVLDAWTMGSVYFGSVSSASVGYSLKYMSKAGKIPIHARDDRVPEFALMSKGLGKNYLTDEMIKWHETDMYNRMYLNYEGQKKCSMPRYYKDKIYTKEQREHIGNYQAGRIADEIQKRINEYDGDYYRDAAEADKAAFDRKNYNAKKTDKL